ncbi:MAG: carbohydrate porin [Gammaproteobacteria bacterium]
MIAAITIFVTAAIAQADDETAVAAPTSTAVNPDFQAGYGDVPEFGGPDGVSGQLKTADRTRESTFRWESPQRFFAPWYEWKGKIQNDHGIALGFFFSLLGQVASDTTTGDDDALGGIYRFQGSWTLVNRGRKDPGRIEWRIEKRSDAFGAQAPSDLSGAVGAAALNTGFGYSSNFKTDIAVLNWTQGFREETVGVAVGRLAFDVYLDAMPFQTFSRGFLNRAFLVNPTIGTTGIGALGAVARGFIGNNFIVGGQIYDGNAASGDFDFDTFKEDEYLKAVDVAWTPSYARRKTDKIRLTYWDKDARQLAGVPSGHGWAVSASWQVNEQWLPFVRFGHSNGGAGVAAECALSGGFEYKVRPDQAWTLGIGWAEPANRPAGTDDETIIETSYKFQLAKNFSLLPDVQVLFNPANNPAKNRIWVFGLRAILTL